MDPLDELIGFVKQADNYQNDSRDFPDPTEPRPSRLPEPLGCTCQEGKKLDCPVHGMQATPTGNDISYDHAWALPQNNPVGYPQDGPRTWQQAYSSFRFAQAKSKIVPVVRHLVEME